MSYREVNWTRRKNDDDVVWTAKTFSNRSWRPDKIDLSFTLESGRCYGIVNRNALLIIRKREEGKKVANKVLMSVEFKDSYTAKAIVDALIFTANILFKNTPHMAEPWFLEQLRGYIADKPEQPSDISKVYYPLGHPY